MTEVEERPGPETEALHKAGQPDINHTPEGYSEDTVDLSTASGYPEAQRLYRKVGWPGVLPLPPRSKYPPPGGFTGRDRDWPSVETLDHWAASLPCDANICLRLDEETVGVDVDAYGTKTGAQTLAEAEKRWGALPPTVWSSSRHDGVSGIRLFRIPAGTVLRDRVEFSDLGLGDIETIQHHHRYVVCSPSVHPDTGKRYRWLDADGATLGTPPMPGELPDLPAGWVSALRCEPTQRAGASPKTVARTGSPTYDVTDAMTGGKPSPKVAQRLGDVLFDLNQGRSRHDTVRGHILALLRYGSNGESGVEFALGILYNRFVEAVGGDRRGGESEAEAEFQRMITNAEHLLDDQDDAVALPGEQARSDSADATPPMPGDELLDQVLAALNRYVKFPDEQSAVGVALWIAATHAIECWNAAPRLVLNSPQKRCGKTRALDVIGGMSHAPLITVNAAPAAVFRSLGGERPPTLIIDEADAIFGTRRAAEQNEELRALLNAGHQRNRPALRCTGPRHEPTEFPTFAMVASAGIGAMPDTITDRAVNITMRRRTRGEMVSQFRSRRDEPVLHHVRDQLAAWARSHSQRLTNAVPDMPVDDRAADTWEPLVAIADIAGGRWPDLARGACIFLVEGASEAEEERSLDIRLLADIRAIFADQDEQFLSSQQLVAELKDVAESPWLEYEYTQVKLARRLRSFGIKAGHNSAKTVRGYRLESFHDAFDRYLRPEVSEPSAATCEEPADLDGSIAADEAKCPDEPNRPDEDRCLATTSDTSDGSGHTEAPHRREPDLAST